MKALLTLAIIIAAALAAAATPVMRSSSTWRRRLLLTSCSTSANACSSKPKRAMEQDRLHATNMAIVQAKIDGAKALEAYYLS